MRPPAAARQGASVLLVEKENCLGGEATKGLVGGPENRFYADTGDGPERVLFGIPAEIVARVYASQFGRELDWADHKDIYWFCHEPEHAKLVLQEMCEEARVQMLLNATITDVLMSESEVQGVVVHSLNGFSALRASIVVDATGDSHVAALAGVPCRTIAAPSTLLFRVSNADLEQTYAFFKEHPEELCRGSVENIERERLTLEYNWERGYLNVPDTPGVTLAGTVSRAVANGDFAREKFGFQLLDRLGIEGVRATGSVQINTGKVRIDGFDPFEITRAEVAGHKVAFFVMDFLRKYVPGYQNAVLFATATRLGRRYSRAVATERDYGPADVGQSFPDSVGTCPHNRHDPSDSRSKSFPYRCLLAKGVEGLLVGSGKNVYSWRPAIMTHRAIPETMVIGQACGAAAAIASRAGKRLLEVRADEVRDALGLNG